MSDALFRCPHCGEMFYGSKEDVGAEAECPSCGNVFVLEESGTTRGKRRNPLMCYLGIFRNYFGFKGRMRRREFWWAFLFWWVVYLISVFADILAWGELGWCTAIVGYGSLIPFAAAHARRLHDTNKRGWWMPLILLAPINIAYFVWLATDGDIGENRFGPDPKGR